MLRVMPSDIAEENLLETDATFPNNKVALLFIFFKKEKKNQWRAPETVLALVWTKP